MTRTLIAGCSLSKNIWDEAIRTAAYLNNRVVRAKKDMTPFEIFTGRKPDLSNLVKFGCQAQALIKNRRLGKFDGKTENVYIVGYTSRRNTYRILMSDLKTVKESCDVAFAKHHKIELLQPKVEQVSLKQYTTNENSNVTVEDFFPKHTINIQSGVTSASGSQENLSKYFDAIPQRIISGSFKTGGTDNEESISSDVSSPAYSDITVTGRNIYDIVNESDNASRNPFDCGSSTQILLVGMTDSQIPLTVGEALRGEDKEHWLKALAEELDAHKANGTFEVVNKPDAKVELTAKWVLNIKRNADGDIERYKARLVARGFKQKYGIDYHETYAPVAKMDSVRVLLAVAVNKGFQIQQFDISTAFLHGVLEEEIYIQAPECIKVKSNQCLRLKKALYGLKQAPKAWNKCFDQKLRLLNFKPLLSDPCIYFNEKQDITIVVYVDDALVIASTKQICNDIIDKLEKEFKLRRITNGTFIGINVRQLKDGGLALSQTSYIDAMAKRFGACDGKVVKTPMSNYQELFIDDDDDVVNNGDYQSLIGSLLYCVLCTRPDALFAVVILSRFNQRAKSKHLIAAQRVLRYLYCSRELSLTYVKGESNLRVTTYSDADHITDPETRRSVSGSVTFINNCLVGWLSRRQSVNALSSCESELIACRESLKNVMWLTNLLSELKLNFSKPKLLVDNHATIKTIQNKEVKRGLKHIELVYHYPISLFENNKYTIEYINTELQLADGLTKPIPEKTLIEHRKASNLLP